MKKVAEKEQIATLFQMNGGENKKIKFFENLSESERSTIQNHTAFDSKEEPVFAFCESETDWCLVTTHRLIFSQVNGLHSLCIDQMREAETDTRQSFKRGVEDKYDLRDIRIETIDGKSMSLTVGSGDPFFTMLKTLKRLCRWAKDIRNSGESI